MFQQTNPLKNFINNLAKLVLEADILMNEYAMQQITWEFQGH